jgi:hypothetical protein
MIGEEVKGRNMSIGICVIERPETQTHYLGNSSKHSIIGDGLTFPTVILMETGNTLTEISYL